MSDQQRDKEIKVEYLPPEEVDTGNEERMEESEPGFSQRLVGVFQRAALRSTLEDIQLAEEVTIGMEKLGRSMGRLQDVENTKKLDAQRTQVALKEQEYKLRKLDNDTLALGHDREEAKSKHKTRLIEDKVSQARLRNDLKMHRQAGRKAEEQPPTLAEELQAEIEKDIKANSAGLEALARERRECQEKVRCGEMTEEEMRHHLAVVEGRIKRWRADRL